MINNSNNRKRNKILKLIECQTYYSDTEQKVVTKIRNLNLTWLGEKNKFQFYKISSDDNNYLGGEITIDTINNTLMYSRELNTSYYKGILISSLTKINNFIYRGISEKINIPENNGIILKFIYN